MDIDGLLIGLHEKLNSTGIPGGLGVAVVGPDADGCPPLRCKSPHPLPRHRYGHSWRQTRTPCSGTRRGNAHAIRILPRGASIIRERTS